MRVKNQTRHFLLLSAVLEILFLAGGLLLFPPGSKADGLPPVSKDNSLSLLQDIIYEVITGNASPSTRSKLICIKHTPAKNHTAKSSKKIVLTGERGLDKLISKKGMIIIPDCK